MPEDVSGRLRRLAEELAESGLRPQEDDGPVSVLRNGEVLGRSYNDE
jgi:hypothetical protein